MNARAYHPTILGSFLALLVTGAAAQTGAAPPSAASAPQHAAAPITPKTHHVTHPRHEHSSSTVSGHDAAYRTALRRCVEGQAQQRESCLDDAIARFGRS
jgi:hypothetical protein